MGAPETGERGKRGGGVDRFPQTGDAVSWLSAGSITLRALRFSGSSYFPAKDFLFVFRRPRRDFLRSAFGNKLPQPLVTVLSGLRRNRHQKPRPP